MNLSKLWAHHPAAHAALFALLGQSARGGNLTLRQRSILVAASASTLGDSYCALGWGSKLAGEVGPDVAAAVLSGDDDVLEPAEHALARWARQITGDPNGTVA